jgi:tol-pal system protein YbgF
MRHGVRFALTVAALALGASLQVAHAALFDDEEARKRIVITNERIDRLQKDLDARLAAVEQQAKNQGLDLFGQLEQIKADLARIRGQIEVLTHELTEAQKRQRDLYVDLDSRMRKLETVPAQAAAPAPADVAAAAAPAGTPVAGGTAPAGTPIAAVAPPPSGGTTPPLSGTLAVPASTPAGNEQRAYDTALDHFKRGDYANSILGFGGFVKTYPKSPLAPSAQYWVGNAQFARKDYRASIAAQRQLIALYPDSQKVPDALLNIASAQSELGENGASRRTLEELVTKYPQSESAGKAKQRLGMR